MKLYKTTAQRAEIGTLSDIVWSGTQAAARQDRNTFRTANAFFIETYEVEIPTSKAELIAFLNANEADLDSTFQPETY